MTEDETMLQAHEVTGEQIATCDLCGRAGGRRIVRRQAGSAAVAEPVEAMRVCRSCWLTIEHDEMSFDEEIGAGLQLSET